MSVFIGPMSGALVAGGVYYGISSLIRIRTEQQRKDLHLLSARLVETPTLVKAPPTAASRISHQPFVSTLKGRWNDEIHNLFAGFSSWEQNAREYSRRLLYGNPEQNIPTKSS